MLGALGLEVTSIWLDGGPWSDLAKVRDASAILSLPMGVRPRASWRIACTWNSWSWTAFRHRRQRTVDGSSRRRVLRERAARRFLGAARESAYRDISRVVQTVFLHKRVAFFGDPHLGQQFWRLPTRSACIWPGHSSLPGTAI